jgi:hypothetical protein
MKPINVIIMDNIMGKHSDDIVRVFDLKGSTFQRIHPGPFKNTTTRKDLNFQEETDFRVQTTEPKQKRLLQIMAKDKEFLKSQRLMDYSLLVVFFKRGFG